MSEIEGLIDGLSAWEADPLCVEAAKALDTLKRENADIWSDLQHTADLEEKARAEIEALQLERDAARARADVLEALRAAERRTVEEALEEIEAMPFGHPAALVLRRMAKKALASLRSTEIGRVPGSQASPEAASHLRPSGFDPAREGSDLAAVRNAALEEAARVIEENPASTFCTHYADAIRHLKWEGADERS